MQRGGLKLNYTNSDKILSLIGFDIDSSIELLLSSDFDKYTPMRTYVKIIEGEQNEKQNCVPVLVYPKQTALERLYKRQNKLLGKPNEQDVPLYMYIQPQIGITYNYILLELLLKRLFVDLKDTEVNLLINTLNQFKKVYLIDVGNIGIKLADIFNFLIMRCDRESKPGHDANLYLFFDKNPEARPIEDENFELSFIKYIKIIKGFDDIRAQNYRNTLGKNMMMIRAFGTHRKNHVSTSNALDDFMFWLLALSINNIFDSNLRAKCNLNNPTCFNTDLILISSDKQKINDPNGNKNLFTELQEIDNFVIYVNGVQNIIISKIAKFVSNKIINDCNKPSENCNPSKYDEDIGIKNAKSCLSESYNNDKAIDIDRVNRFWLFDKITDNDIIMLQNLKTVVSSMNNLHPSIHQCNLFEKFMTLIRYLQYIYFNCAEKIEKETDKKHDKKTDKKHDKIKPYTSKPVKYIPSCAMNDTIRRSFIFDQY